MKINQSYKFSVAPMMDWTDRHCRMFHRAFSANTLLWSEMVTADAVIHGDRDRLIGFSDAEHPVVLQLGGSDPAKLAEASRIAEAFGYDEVNINCGCPSDRVQSGRFGACLMQEPAVVADCVAAMRAAVSIPVTVKCRVAVDEDPPRETLFGFVDQVSDAGCEVFTVHARKAWLSGLSPKENRDIPPLDYGLVADLKAERPELSIILNGGIKTLDECADHLKVFDGVMLGRAPYQTPQMLGGVDHLLETGEAAPFDEAQAAMDALAAYRGYMAEQLEAGAKLSSMTRHMMGLFTGLPGARAYRRTLSEKAVKTGAGLDVLDEAVSHINLESVDA
ncbi:tRNA dihydrouridine(20/20a) synthase DusA [Henriciella litoralis]|uniref:tRNA dihydrouridine(20/20a) synthase DusA n=1 Tax=Henriciella litoralis TaxID=568102 RepID=UPI0009FF318A|nr:tRNA dihydrouridine(20/20a) synthase DusA [Henriciella litoralis]